jgi:GAF domain-containing protein
MDSDWPGLTLRKSTTIWRPNRLNSAFVPKCDEGTTMAAEAIDDGQEPRSEDPGAITRLKKLSETLLTDNLDPAEEEVAGGCCDLLSVPVCIVWQRAEHEQLLRVVAASANVDEEYRSLELPLDSPGIRAALNPRAVKWIEDVRIPQERYGHSDMAEKRGWVSMLSVPMVVAKRLVGMVDVYTFERRRFESREREVFSTFANYMALSLTRSASRRRLEAIIDLLQEMSAAPTVAQLMRIFLAGGLKVMGATQGWIGRLDPSTGDLRVELSEGEPTGSRTLKWGEGVTGNAVKTGTAINVQDVTAPDSPSHEAFWPDTRSVLAVPLVVPHAEVHERAGTARGTKTIGVLSFESPRKKAFTPTYEKLLESLAQHAAVGIDKLESEERLEQLRVVEKKIGQIDTFKETALEVLEAVRSPLGYDVVNISIVEPEARRIKTEFVSSGLSEADEREFRRMADHSLESDDIQAYVVREGRPEVPPRTVDAHAALPYKFDPEIFARFGHQDLIRVFVPMRLPDNRVFGTIEAGYRQAYPRFIYEADVKVLQDFADYAARALDHNNLFSINYLVTSLLNEGLAAVGATQGAVLMLDKVTDVLKVIERKGRPYAPGNVPLKLGEGSAGMAVRDRRPRIIGDVLDPVQAPEFIHPKDGRSPSFRSMLIVPILYGDGCLGAICALAEELNKFTDAHARRLTEVCKGFAPSMAQLGVDAFMGHTKRLLELERFHQVAEELGRSTLDLDELRNHIVEAAEAILEAQPVVLYLYDEKRRKFEVPPTLSRDIRKRGAMTGDVFDRHAPYRIVQKGESHFASAAATDDIMNGQAGLDGDSFVVREGIVSSAGILLKADAATVGVLFVNYRHSRTFSNYEQHIIGGFAGSVALAVRKARVVRDAMRRTQLTALRRNRDDMSHRLKSPLISMNRRFTKLRRLATAEMREWVEQASELNRHVQQLVKEFNTDPQRSVKVAPLAPTELGALIRKALVASAMHDETRISVRVDTGLPTVNLDRVKLRDDFMGLLHDSEKHAGGAAVVDVDVTVAGQKDLEDVQLTPGRRFVKIVYRDQGPGIRPDLKERVFEPWLSIGGGTGHGLAILRDNATARGGTARECGEHTKGVRFEIYIPASDGPRGDREVP